MIKMVRVISLSDRAYGLLLKLKKNNSFSKVIEELVEKNSEKGDISKLEKFFGVLSDKNAELWTKETIESRARSQERKM